MTVRIDDAHVAYRKANRLTLWPVVSQRNRGPRGAQDHRPLELNPPRRFEDCRPSGTSSGHRCSEQGVA